MAVVIHDDAPQMLAAAAAQLGEWINPERLAKGQPITLGEYFPVVTLSLSALRDAVKNGTDLSRAVEPTGRWHVQVALDGKPYGYLRLISEPEWAIEAFHESTLAVAIDRAIDAADANLGSDDYLTYLLDATANAVGALLFVPRRPDDDVRAIVFRTPFAQGSVKRWIPYRAATLMRALSAHVPMIGYVQKR
jgi:hypothetical protein